MEIKVQVKFGGDTIPVLISEESTVGELKERVQGSTNVLVRGQKLIYKGKVMEDGSTLRRSEVRNGSKIMLMATEGLHQGKDAGVVSNYSKIMKAKPKPKPTIKVEMGKARSERWKVTGVIGLSESSLKEIPEQVWECGSSARLVDLSNNSISQLPIQLASFTSLQKLILNCNDINDDSVCWEALSHLTSLLYLSFDHNHLTHLPPPLGALISLEQLHVAANNLTSLPIELGYLARLQILKLNHNRLSVIPPCIGDCRSLTEVDISSNLLENLPETFGSLQNLKVLHLGHNGLKTLPSSIFKKCIKLSTLGLHGTEITMDVLRQVEGWKEFDERRRLKYQKQLDFRAGGSGEFDEGADKC